VVTSPERLIQRKAAGVSVTSNGRAPGAGSNNPLIVVDITADYAPLTRILPPEYLPCADDAPKGLTQRLLPLVARMRHIQLATSKWQSKTAKSKAYVDGKAQVSTARGLKEAKRP